MKSAFPFFKVPFFLIFNINRQDFADLSKILIQFLNGIPRSQKLFWKKKKVAKQTKSQKSNSLKLIKTPKNLVKIRLNLFKIQQSKPLQNFTKSGNPYYLFSTILDRTIPGIVLNETVLSWDSCHLIILRKSLVC